MNAEKRRDQRTKLDRQLILCRALIDELRTGQAVEDLRDLEVDLLRRLQDFEE